MSEVMLSNQRSCNKKTHMKETKMDRLNQGVRCKTNFHVKTDQKL